jgi:hypothetical protein
MSKLVGFAVTCAFLCGAISIASAADAGGWVTCKDGMQMHGGGQCWNHGGEVIPESKAIPIDTTKGLAPNKTAATKKTKTQKTAAAGETKKKTVSNRSNTPTAKCRDGAMYFSLDRHGACGNHGGVHHWY